VLATVLIGLLVLSLLVLAHEYGHFFAAKRLGIRVERFSIGFGRKLIGFTRGETEYCISALLFGGYVKMAGDNPEEASETAPQPGDFLTAPWWKKSVIAVAGPAANFVLAGVFFVGMYGVGIPQPIMASIVGPVEPGSATARVGFDELDHIVSVDGHRVSYWHEFYRAWEESEEREKETGKPAGHTIAVTREGQRLTLTVPDSLEQGVLSSLQSWIRPQLGEVSVGTPAYQAGLMSGDIVHSVDGRPVHSWQDLQAEVRPNANKELTFVIERDGKLIEVRITPIPAEPASSEPSGMIGVMPPNQGTFVQHFGAVESVKLGVLETGFRVEQLYAGLWSLVSDPRHIRNSLAGPVSVVQISGEVGKKGFSDFLNIAGFISLALMVMNLLPIPVLDGGHIMFSLIEAVRGGPLAPRKMVLLQRVGMAILASIMIFAFVNDLARISQRERAKEREMPVGEEMGVGRAAEQNVDSLGR
jgi:regulator of sigma E protease